MTNPHGSRRRPILLLIVSLLAKSNAWMIPAPVIHFGFGAVAGGVGAFAAYPFDYLKSQLQSSSDYKNGWDALQSIEGPLQLFKGVGVQVLGIVPEKAIKLGMNDVVLSWWTHSAATVGVPLYFQIVAGSVAGACQVLATSPLEVVKIGLQTSDRSLPEVIDQVGFSGLYKGADVCMFRDVVFTAVCFPLYTYLINSVAPNHFLAGAIAGMVSTTLVTPPDFIKTRIITAEVCESPDKSLLEDFLCKVQLSNDAEEEEMPSRNPFRVAEQIIRFEGMAVLFTGVTERAVGAIPRFGVTLSLHDYLENIAMAQHWIQ